MGNQTHDTHQAPDDEAWARYRAVPAPELVSAEIHLAGATFWAAAASAICLFAIEPLLVRLGEWDNERFWPIFVPPLVVGIIVNALATAITEITPRRIGRVSRWSFAIGFIVADRIWITEQSWRGASLALVGLPMLLLFLAPAWIASAQLGALRWRRHDPTRSPWRPKRPEADALHWAMGAFAALFLVAFLSRLALPTSPWTPLVLSLATTAALAAWRTDRYWTTVTASITGTLLGEHAAFVGSCARELEPCPSVAYSVGLLWWFVFLAVPALIVFALGGRWIGRRMRPDPSRSSWSDR